jgi:uncharacterized protein YbjQ (UPF0145 family)
MKQESRDQTVKKSKAKVAVLDDFDLGPEPASSPVKGVVKKAAAAAVPPPTPVGKGEPTLFDRVQKRSQESQRNETASAPQEARRNEMTTAPPVNLIVSSGNICQPYDVIDLVMAHAVSKETFLSKISSIGAYKEVLQSLKERAVELGADALIYVSFQSNLATVRTFLASVNAYEVVAWGTAVRFTS